MRHERTTPAGFRVVFEDGLPDPETGKSKRRTYTIDGAPVPSVTTVTGMLDKPGMRYAAERLTLEGAIALDRSSGLPKAVMPALDALKDKQLRFYQQWDQRAKLGTQTHDNFVALACGDDIDESKMPQDQRAFCKGIRKWAEDYRPEILQEEVMVASKLHGFAGRFDLLCRLSVGTKNIEALPAKVRVDLKTSDEIQRLKSGQAKPPYPEHLLQLAGYEIAARESGDPHANFQAILRVDAQGDYDFAVSLVAPERFLDILRCYQAIRAVSSTPAERRALAA